MNDMKNLIKRITIPFIFLLFFIGAIIVRFIPYNEVITDNIVLLQSTDAYYFLQEAMLMKNGQMLARDLNLCFPDGIENNFTSDFTYPWLLKSFSNIAPVDLVAAYSSPMFGLIGIIFIILTLREILSVSIDSSRKKIGLIAGTSVATLSGIQFIARTYFGYADRHALEACLFFALVFFLLKSFRNAKSLIPDIFAGFCVLFLSWTWGQSFLLVLALIVGMFAYYILYPKIPKGFVKKNIIFLLFFLSGNIFFFNPQFLLIGIFGLICLGIGYYVNKFFKSRKTRFGISIIIFSIVIALIFLLTPSIFQTITDKIINYFMDQKMGTSEAQDLFSIYSNFFAFNSGTWQVLLILISIPGLVLLFKHGGLIIAVPGLILAILTFAKIRTEYLYLIFMAIGTGYFAARYPKITFLIIGFSILCFYNIFRYDIKMSSYFKVQDYLAAEALRNLPSSTALPAEIKNVYETPAYGVLADWEMGYLFSYVSGKAMVATPNLCNISAYAKILGQKNPELAKEILQKNKYKYLVIRKGDAGAYVRLLNELRKEVANNIILSYNNNLDTAYKDSMLYKLYFGKEQIAGFKEIYSCCTQDPIKIFDIVQ
jgi:asparagine N-glycosylation enzyme membrane subunit Stt3